MYVALDSSAKSLLCVGDCGPVSSSTILATTTHTGWPSWEGEQTCVRKDYTQGNTQVGSVNLKQCRYLVDYDANHPSFFVFLAPFPTSLKSSWKWITFVLLITTPSTEVLLINNLSLGLIIVIKPQQQSVCAIILKYLSETVFVACSLSELQKLPLMAGTVLHDRGLTAIVRQWLQGVPFSFKSHTPEYLACFHVPVFCFYLKCSSASKGTLFLLSQPHERATEWMSPLKWI